MSTKCYKDGASCGTCRNFISLQESFVPEVFCGTAVPAGCGICLMDIIDGRFAEKPVFRHPACVLRTCSDYESWRRGKCRVKAGGAK